jgi:hypothetical protein
MVLGMAKTGGERRGTKSGAKLGPNKKS